MFKDTTAYSSFSVPDLDEAKRFYGETLGLKTSEENGLLTLQLAGDRPTLIYPKPDHRPANYTILNFPVEDIDAAVRPQGLLDGHGHGVAVGHVARDRKRLAARRLDRRHRRVRGQQVDGDDGRPARGERLRDRPSDRTGGAGDDRDSVAQVDVRHRESSLIPGLAGVSRR